MTPRTRPILAFLPALAGTLVPVIADALAAQSPWVLLQDVRPGFTGSSPRSFCERQGRLWFWAADALYTTDGTPAGTVRAVEPAVIGTEIAAEDMVTANNLLWFSSSLFNPTIGAEPWVSDGTNGGTRIVVDLKPGSASSLPRFFTDLGDRCAFLADTDAFAGPSLVVSDGSAAGTVAVAAAANPSPGTHRFGVLGRKVFFTGRDAATGNELWAYDLNTGTASLVRDLAPGATSSNPWIAGVAHDRVWFHAQGTNGMQIWTSDGTAAGTNPIPTALFGFELSAVPFAATSTKVFLRTAVGMTRRLYAWDRATGGLTWIQNLAHAADLCALDHLCIVVGQATTGSPATPWRSDGTVAGTVQLGTVHVAAVGMRRIGSRHVFFIGGAPQPTPDRELWRTDGTAAGTRLHADVNPNRYGFADLDFQAGVIHGGICWSANHELYGQEPTWSGLGTGISQPIGTGCGAVDTRLLASDAVLGGNLSLVGTGSFGGSVGLVFLMRPTPTPIPFGAGCFLYGNPSLLILLDQFLVGSPAWSRDLPLPGTPALVGVRVVLQTFYAGGATPGGLAATNGILCDLGH